jgi:hypothetical protein
MSTATTKGSCPANCPISLNNASPVQPRNRITNLQYSNCGYRLRRSNSGYYYWNGAAWFSLSRKGKAIGDMRCWTGGQWTNIPAGVNGSVLTLYNGVPKWGRCSDSIVFNSGSGGHAIYATHNDSDSSWAMAMFLLIQMCSVNLRSLPLQIAGRLFCLERT